MSERPASLSRRTSATSFAAAAGEKDLGEPPHRGHAIGMLERNAVQDVRFGASIPRVAIGLRRIEPAFAARQPPRRAHRARPAPGRASLLQEPDQDAHQISLRDHSADDVRHSTHLALSSTVQPSPRRIAALTVRCAALPPPFDRRFPNEQGRRRACRRRSVCHRRQPRRHAAQRQRQLGIRNRLLELRPGRRRHRRRHRRRGHLPAGRLRQLRSRRTRRP